jgi:hypothetical protein
MNARLEAVLYVSPQDRIRIEPAPERLFPGEYVVRVNGHLLGFVTTECLGRAWAALTTPRPPLTALEPVSLYDALLAGYGRPLPIEEPIA